MKYQDIFFDLDGTLSMSHMGIYGSLDYMFDAIGMERPVDRYPLFIGPMTETVLVDEFGFTEEEAVAAYTHFTVYSDAKGLYDAVPYEGVTDMLERLRAAGKRLYVATGRRIRIAGKCVEALGLMPYVDGVFGFDRDRGIVNKTLLLEDVKKKLPPLECPVMIGDRAVDIIGGRENGMATVFVGYGYGSREEMEGCRPDKVADSVEELCRELMR